MRKYGDKLLITPSQSKVKAVHQKIGELIRRHPNKSKAWKWRKYFTAAGDQGAFSVETPTKEGERRVLSLYRTVSTVIERHIKVRGTANPYDPKDTEYFEMRRCFLWRVLWGGRPPERVPIAAACLRQEHRLERLEPYEGKLSITVLRGGAGWLTACLHSTQQDR